MMTYFKYILSVVAIVAISGMNVAQEVTSNNRLDEANSVSTSDITLMPKQATPNEKTISIENEFIKIIVNKGPKDQGRFALETTLGDPDQNRDDFQSLIYGRPIPWTSYTTILIDGKPYVFGGLNTKIKKRAGSELNYGDVISQFKTSDAIITECRFGEINVIQRLSFFRNPATKVKDMALISYDIYNLDTVSHTVAVRIMLDTKLGKNDGAPFRIGDQAISSETRFSKKTLQDYWQTFDSLASPNVIAQGILRERDGQIEAPDELYLANWGSLVDQPWNFNYQKGRSFIREGELEKDTALALYWKAQSVAPKKSRSVQTVYGLGGLTLSKGELSLGLTAPAEVNAKSKKAILMMGYVSNTGSFDSRDTQINFKLPKELIRVEGEVSQNIGLLRRGETRQIPIKVRTSSKARAGKKTIVMMAKSSTLADNQISRKIDVLAPPELEAKLIVPPNLMLVKSRYVTVSMKIKNPSGLALEDVSAGIHLDDALALPSFEKAKKKIQELGPFSEETISWTVMSRFFQNRKAVITVKLAAPSAKTKRYKKTITLIKGNEFLAFSQSKTPIKTDDYFYMDLSLNYTDPFSDRDFSLQYDSHYLKLIRVSPHAFLREKSDALSKEPNRIYVKALSSQSKNKRLPVLKLHFKALKPGVTDIILKQDQEVKQIKSLSINPK